MLKDGLEFEQAIRNKTLAKIAQHFMLNFLHALNWTGLLHSSYNLFHL